MERLRRGIEFIFSSYKRTAAILVIAGLALAIPITINFLGQEQDIRQRAEDIAEDDDIACLQVLTQAKNINTGACQTFPTSCLPEGWVKSENCGDDVTPTSTPSPTMTPTPTATQTPTITPSPTPTGTAQNETKINIALQLTGIGNATSSALGINNNPKRPTRDIEVKIFNSQNQEILSKAGSVTFDRASGLYKGTVSFGNSISTGSYIVKVKMDNTLWKQVPGIQILTSGTTNNLPTTQLVSGEIAKQDNELNLFDYNKLIGCLRGNAEVCQ